MKDPWSLIMVRETREGAIGRSGAPVASDKAAMTVPEAHRGSPRRLTWLLGSCRKAAPEGNIMQVSMGREADMSKGGGPTGVRVKRDLVTGGITVAAILMFVGTGSMVLPDTLRSVFMAGGGADKMLVSALLLNIALILFGWRRCGEMRQINSARANAEEDARRAAYCDFTTGLPNRRALIKAASQACSRGMATTLLVVDLDHFKTVNDLYGHSTGDRLLKEVGAIINRCAPHAACSARLGGDEFAILLIGAAAAPEEAERVADALIEKLAEPILLDDTVARVAASVGIASTDDQCNEVEELLTRSDIAMYSAKKRGRNRSAWFDKGMQEELKRRNQIEADMRLGIGEGQFVPFFQPQINLASGELQGFEVLARWNHPTRGVIEPSDFIEVAEASGMIADLSLSVMRQALVNARDWDPRLIIAVNISPVQLKDPLLAQRVSQMLVSTGFPAGRLELEITESSFLESLDVALATIESLKNLGVTISLDDFGTGYSSLTQLKALPFDRIKVDRSFVSSMLESEESAAIVTAIVNLGASLSLPVTAEGVETSAIQDGLMMIGCSEGQGWLFGRPLPADQLGALLSAKEGQIDPSLVSLLAPPLKAEAGSKERRDHHRRGSRRKTVIKAAAAR
jgi:diguanylate cyclase (GGDEF)-like protein